MEELSCKMELLHTLREQLRTILPLFSWPPYSPDLNPICNKNWIYERCGDRRMRREEIRDAVKGAWEAITEGRFDELINEMQDRCRAVMTARGFHTKY
jgi:hypothetical protein